MAGIGGPAMTSIDDIAVQVEAMHGNVRPILNEVLHALDQLLESEEPTVIDLAGLPFAPGELEELEATLGTGELSAKLDALGSSRIRETAYPGVWWVRYTNSMGTLILNTLEITDIPIVACAAQEDLDDSRQRFQELLEPYWQELG